MDIIQQMTSTAQGIAAGVIILGLCILFHETGHFIAAKLARMRVDEFSVGFGPPVAGFTRGETLYSLRWIPLGGFVRIAGMEPGEVNVERGFHSRPRWMGAIVIVAGVAMNLVLAVLLYGLAAYSQGVAAPDSRGNLVGNIFPGTPASHSALEPGDEIVALDGNRSGLSISQVAPGSPAEKLGLKPDDRILQVEDNLVAVPSELLTHLAQGQGETRRVVVVDSAATSLTEAFKNIGMPALLHPADDDLSPAEAESLLHQHLGLSFAPLTQPDIVTYTSLQPKQTLRVTVLREGEEVTLPVGTEATSARVLKVNAQGQITSPHMTTGRMGLILTTPTQPISLQQAATLGVAQSVGAVRLIIDSLRGLVSRKLAATPGGPVSILAMTYQQAQLGWLAVASFGGFISANLAVFNLLPIPPLDGFVLLALAYEAILRRRIDARAENLVRIAGFVLIIGLFLSLTFNDIANLIIHHTP